MCGNCVTSGFHAIEFRWLGFQAQMNFYVSLSDGILHFAFVIAEIISFDIFHYKYVALMMFVFGYIRRAVFVEIVYTQRFLVLMPRNSGHCCRFIVAVQFGIVSFFGVDDVTMSIDSR